MFKRLFGTNKSAAEEHAESEEVKEQQKLNAEERATAAMVSIRETMDGLQKKIDTTQKQIDDDFRRAAELKKKNKDDPQIKILLTKVKRGRERIVQYNKVLLQQQSTLATVDDMTFLNEMVAVMETTKKALDSAYADSGDKLQQLMDDIQERKDDVDNMMSILTETQEEPDVDDLMAELDEAVKNEAEPSVANPDVSLPSAPTAVPSATAQSERDEEAELEAMLEGL